MEIFILSFLGSVSGLAVSTRRFERKWDFIFGILGALASYYLVQSFSFLNFISKSNFGMVLPMLGSVVVIYIARSFKFLRF
jgi:uncharacterized membrane protein YeaQ/YmgE (transglycosylase-associated protein family)